MIFYSRSQLAGMNLRDLCDALVKTRDQYADCMQYSTNNESSSFETTPLIAFQYASEEMISRCNSVSRKDHEAKYNQDAVNTLCVINRQLRNQIREKEAVIHYLEGELCKTKEFADMFARELNKNPNDKHAVRKGTKP